MKKGFVLSEFILSGSAGDACKENKSRNWCTTLIQLNNWKIPDNYPFDVK